MHSSRMRTARTMTVVGGVCGGGACVAEGGACVAEGGCVAGGGPCMVVGGRAWQRGGMRGGGGSAWPCDLSHHAFDVTCMLPPHQLRPTNSAAPYIVLVGHVTRTPPPCEQNE